MENRRCPTCGVALALSTDGSVPGQCANCGAAQVTGAGLRGGVLGGIDDDFKLDLRDFTTCGGCGKDHYAEDLKANAAGSFHCRRCSKPLSVPAHLSGVASASPEGDGARGGEPAPAPVAPRASRVIRRRTSADRPAAGAKSPAVEGRRFVITAPLKREMLALLANGQQTRARSRILEMTGGRQDDAQRIINWFMSEAERLGVLNPPPSSPTLEAPPQFLEHDSGLISTDSSGSRRLKGFRIRDTEPQPPEDEAFMPGLAPPGFEGEPPGFSSPPDASLTESEAVAAANQPSQPQAPREDFSETLVPLSAGPASDSAGSSRTLEAWVRPEGEFLQAIARRGRALRGATLLRAGRADEAEAFLMDVAARDEGDPWSRMVKAEIFEQHGQLEAARGRLNDAVCLAPESAEARRRLVAFLLRHGPRSEAVANLRRLLDLGVESPDHWRRCLVRLALELGDLEVARETMTPLPEGQERSPEALALQAWLKANAGEHVAAREILGELLEVEEPPRDLSRLVARSLLRSGPESPGLSMILADLEFQAGCPERAVFILSQVMERESGTVPQRRAMARYCLAAGLDRRAEVELRALVDLGEEAAGSAIELGRLQLAAGNVAEARAFADQARTAVDKSSELLVALSELDEGCGDLRHAVSDLRAAVEQSEADHGLVARLERLRRQWHRLRLAELEQRVGQAEENPEESLELAQILHDLGRDVEALDLLPRAERDPYQLPRLIELAEAVVARLVDRRRGQLYLAELYRRCHEPEKARLVLDDIAVEPGDLELVARLARVMLESGNAAGAAERLEHVVEELVLARCGSEDAAAVEDPTLALGLEVTGELATSLSGRVGLGVCRGRLNWLRGDAAAAVAAFEEALTSGAAADVQVDLAMIQLGAGQLAEGVMTLQAACNASGVSDQMRIVAARLALDHDRAALSLQLLESVTESASGSAEALALSRRARSQLARSGLAALREQLTAQPGDAMLRQRLVGALVDSGDHVGLRTQALAWGGDPWALACRQMVSESRGDEALEWMREEVRLAAGGEQEAAARRRLAGLCQELQRRQDEACAWLALLDVVPGDDEALVELARLVNPERSVMDASELPAWSPLIPETLMFEASRPGSSTSADSFVARVVSEMAAGGAALGLFEALDVADLSLGDGAPSSGRPEEQ